MPVLINVRTVFALELNCGADSLKPAVWLTTPPLGVGVAAAAAAAGAVVGAAAAAGAVVGAAAAAVGAEEVLGVAGVEHAASALVIQVPTVTLRTARRVSLCMCLVEPHWMALRRAAANWRAAKSGACLVIAAQCD